MAMEKRKDSKNRVLKEGEHQRANGTYEFKWRDKKGKRHSVYAKTLEELREKEKAVIRDVLDGIRADRNDITINDLYNRWAKLKKGLKDNTFQHYKYIYSQFVEHDFGNTRIADLKRSDVRAFYNFLADEQHVKITSIDNLHTVLHQVLELGVDDDYIRYNPSDNALKELKRTHNDNYEKRRALTVPEQALFERFLSKEGPYHRWYPIFIVMLYTGLRVGEVTGLRWCDIDFEEGTISVNHTLVYFDKGGSERCSSAVNTPKTKAGTRTVTMLSKVKEAFLMEKAFQEELGIKCNAAVDGYTDFIFLNRFGGVHHQATLNKALKNIIRDCNYEILDKGTKDTVFLPNFTNHTLRHTFATRMCEAKVNIKVMQDILGHADAETTLQIYTDATMDFKKSEMLGLETFFKVQEKQCDIA